MPVVPTEFIPTNEAVERFINEDPLWQALNEKCSAANGTEKDKAHLELGERTNALSLEFGKAVLDGDLTPVAIKRTGGAWKDYPLPGAYWESSHSDEALWTGEVVRLGLPPKDQWIADSPLCLRKKDFNSWLAQRRGLSSCTSGEEPRRRTVAAVKQWLTEKYPGGTAKTQKALAIECSKELGIPVSDRSVRRAQGGR